MKTFDPGSFTDVSSTPLANAIWKEINSSENIIRMITATELGKPAAAILGMPQYLLTTFKKDLKLLRSDRYKQMIGRMVKQILLDRGFHLDKRDVKINYKNNLFSYASRYSK